MTEIITPTTELEAVNAILASVGEAPVVSLDDSFTDAQLARQLLAQESRRVQSSSWHFNTEVGVTLTPDHEGFIWLPANTFRVLIADNRDIVQRGRRLYDRANHTYVFTEEITADLVVGLPFDELPESLRLFLTIRAGRRFQDRLQGDRVLHEFQAQDEMAAWAAFQNYEAEVGNYNILNNNPLVMRMKGRR